MSWIENEVACAYLDQRSFEEQSAKIMKAGFTYFGMMICPKLMGEKECSKGEKCDHAQSLAEFYAFNISIDSTFKTTPCEWGDRCKNIIKCGYGHVGDLMRDVRIANVW